MEESQDDDVQDGETEIGVDLDELVFSTKKTGIEVTKVASEPLQLVTTEGTALKVYLHNRSALHLGASGERDHGMEAEEEGEHGGNGHGHHEKPPSLVPCIASAIINFLLMFGLCSAYGMIMFYDPWHKKLAPLGVKMNLGTAMIAGLLLACFSKVPVAIGGPDLNPVVFIAGMIEIAAEEIATDVGLVYPEVERRRLLANSASPLDALRRLGGSSDEEFCTGYHLKYHEQECDDYMVQLKATVGFIVFASTAVLGLVYFLLGSLKVTRYVSYLPTSVVEAFLSCIGFKVFKYAIKFCNKEPKQFLPAAIIGVVMYFMKALHIGNPAIVLPLVLIVPLVGFYIITVSMGLDSDDLRGEELMFPEMKDIEFWKIWTDGFLKVESINFKAWQKTIIDLVIMVIVCTMDCLLKISATATKMPVKVDTDYEAQLYGMCNAPIMLCGCSVGYMQLKFNVINYGIIGNIKDRRAGIIYAALCGACFFGTIKQINYMPRFFLGTMLFFAGAGFVAENLWGSKQYLNLQEWLQIIIILLVFAVTESMLYAVLVGGVLTALHFVMQYAKVPCTLGSPRKGCKGFSSTVLEMVVQEYADHFTQKQVMVVRLKGFIFFASAQNLLKHIVKNIEASKEGPEYSQLKYIILDCKQLDSMDASALKGFMRLKGQVESLHCRLVWAGISPALYTYLSSRGLIKGGRKEWYFDLESAVNMVEEEAVGRLRRIQDMWVSIHPFLSAFHAQALQHHGGEPFHHVLTQPAARMGIPWQFCGRMQLKKFETVLWTPGSDAKNGKLYLVHRGAVGVFGSKLACTSASAVGDEFDPEGIKSAQHRLSAPKVVYTHGNFMNVEVLEHKASEGYGIAIEDGEVVYWDEARWQRMMRTRPHMATSIMMAAMTQVSTHGRAAREALKLETDGEKSEEPPLCVQQSARSMLIVSKLEQLGFFDIADGEESELPPLPTAFRRDLEVAFATFATPLDVANVPTQQKIPWESIKAALMYAGVFGLWLTDEPQRPLTRHEFIALGHNMFLASLTKAQLAKVHGFFQSYDEDGSGSLSTDELVVVLREKVDPNLKEEEITGIVVAIDSSQSGALELEEFVSLMSWMIMQHASMWLLLRGVRELRASAAALDIGKEDILKAASGSGSITELQAEEMLWAASIYSPPKDNNSKSMENSSEGKLDVPLLASLLSWGHGSRQPLPAPAVVPSNLKALKQEVLPKVDVAAFFKDPRRTAPLDFAASRKEAGLGKEKNRMSSAQLLTEDVKAIETRIEKHDQALLPPPTCRSRVGNFLEDPESSTMAHIFSVFIGVIILSSVLLLVLEPLLMGSKESSVTSEGDALVYWYFDAVVTGIFLLEYVARLVTASAIGYDSTLAWMLQPLNIADLVALLPFFMDLAFSAQAGELRLMRIARLMRLSRIIRMGRLASKSTLFPPVAAVLVVIWGIYLKTKEDD